MLASNCKRKSFSDIFQEMRGKGKNSKSLNLSKGDADLFNEYLLVPDFQKANQIA